MNCIVCLCTLGCKLQKSKEFEQLDARTRAKTLHSSKGTLSIACNAEYDVAALPEIVLGIESWHVRQFCGMNKPGISCLFLAELNLLQAECIWSFPFKGNEA